MTEDNRRCLTLNRDDYRDDDDRALDHLRTEYLDALFPPVAEFDIRPSVFDSGRIPENHSAAVDRLRSALDYELHRHFYQHAVSESPGFETGEPPERAVYRECSGGNPFGYRAPGGVTSLPYEARTSRRDGRDVACQGFGRNRIREVRTT